MRLFCIWCYFASDVQFPVHLIDPPSLLTSALSPSLSVTRKDQPDDKPRYVQCCDILPKQADMQHIFCTFGHTSRQIWPNFYVSARNIGH